MNLPMEQSLEHILHLVTKFASPLLPFIGTVS